MSLFERPSHVDSFRQNGINLQKNDAVEQNLKTQLRPIIFFFSGRLLLWLPERVCSVRHTVATQLSSRPDTVIVNVSESQSYGPVRESALGYLFNSTFCLVTRTDSYSSAFFYDALQAGCIPVVVRCVFLLFYCLSVPLNIRMFRCYPSTARECSGHIPAQHHL